MSSTSLTFDAWKARTKSFEHDGLSQSYTDVGKGDVILLLHGYPTWSYDWVDVIPALSKSYRVIAPDWIGYGLSDKPKHHVPIPDQINRLSALLDSLNIKTFHLVAHDYGSTCAQEILSRSELASRVKSLTLMNGGIVQSAYRPTRTQKLLLTPLGGLVTRLLSKDSLRKKLDALRGHELRDDQFDALWQGVCHDNGLRKSHLLQRYILERRANYKNWEGALIAYAGPCQLIWGPLDPISGAHVLAPLKDMLPRAIVIELDDVGHFVPDEAPERVSAAILDFISKSKSHA